MVTLGCEGCLHIHDALRVDDVVDFGVAERACAAGLDEGVALYDKGTKIAKECLKELNEVKGKITIIKKEIDSYKEEDFD